MAGDLGEGGGGVGARGGQVAASRERAAHAIRLLQRDDAWQRVALPVDKQTFLQRLDQVREARNAVMHFSPDSPTPKDTETLRVFLAVMQDLGERTRS